MTALKRTTTAAMMALLLSTGTMASPDTNSHISKLFELERQQLSQATRVYFPSKILANKASITFHNQLLESHKDKGYLIMALSDSDKDKLKSFGFTFKPATQWIARRNKAINRLQKQAATSVVKNPVVKRSVVKNPSTKNAVTVADSIPGFACYSTVEGTFESAAGLAAQYPQLAQWQDIGDSWAKQDSNGTAGFDIKVLKITNQARTGDKPVLFIHSAMHAREYATAELTLRFAQQLLNDYDSDADTRWILDHNQVHIVFHMNPDGRKMAETGLFWRKNINESACGVTSESRGVDLNRNFSHFWNAADGSSGEACAQTYRGPSPASEPETQAIESYIRSIFADRRGSSSNDAAPLDTSGMHIDIHSYSELVLWPWGHTENAAPNAAALATLGRKLAYFNAYEPMQSIGLYATDGTSDDVSYGELGVPAYTFELGTNFFQDCETFENTILPNNLKALFYAAKVVRAPYITPSGPDSIQLNLNNQSDLVIPPGIAVKLTTKVTDTLYRNSNGTEPSQVIAGAEYTVDQVPWSTSAQPIALQSSDGSLDSSSEPMEAQLDTREWAAGKHTVYVRAKDTDGNWGAVSAIYLTISDDAQPVENSLPTANFSVDCTDLSCSFDASSSTDSDGSIAAYQWVVSPNITGQGVSIDHQFSATGSYTVDLTVTDNQGGIASLSKTIEVEAAVEPTPTPEPTPPPVTPPPAVDNSGNGGGGSFGWWMGLVLLVCVRWRLFAECKKP